MVNEDDEKISNAEIERLVPPILDQYSKEELLKEVEKELGLPPTLRGFNDTDATFSKETMAEILIGVRWLKSKQ
jgi:hypothetical protein